MGLLQRSMAAGFLIIGVLLLRCLASGKLPKRLFTALWEMAALRLLLPFSLPVESGLFGRRVNHVIWAVGNEAAEFSSGREGMEAIRFFTRYAGIIWFLGVLLMALFFLYGYSRTYFRLREAIPWRNIEGNNRGIDSMKSSMEHVGGNRREDTNENAGERAEVSAGENIREAVEYSYRLTKGVNISILDRILTPMTYGILCPHIILPKTMDLTDKEMLSYVLKHEMVHIRRMDNLWKLLASIALCFHWFNPLAYVMYFFLNRDMEIACDEHVISSMGKRGRQKYALTLVMLAERSALFSAAYSGFGKSAVSERINKIMNYKKISKAGSLCAALIMLCGAAVFVSAKEPVAAEPLAAAEVTEGADAANMDYKKCVTVFFEEDIPEGRVEEIGTELLALKGVSGVGYTSSEEAWDFFVQEYLGEKVSLSFTENPLKNSDNYTVYLTDDSETVIRAIENIDGVRKVFVE